MAIRFLDPKLARKYIHLLGIVPKAPSLEALSEVVSCHLMRIPFETVSKLHYRKQPGLQSLIHIESYLDGIERFHFGGTCYANNYYLYLLLMHLGYEAFFCGADMEDPDVHTWIRVELEGREYLVDVGYAAPFTQPLPRDLDEDVEVVFGQDRYVLRRQNEDGHSPMELHRYGKQVHGYRAKPTPRSIEFFEEAIADSLTDRSTFMNELLMVRFYPGRTVSIRGLSLIESQATESHARRLTNQRELVDAIVTQFGMPREIVVETTSDLRQVREAWG